ncbi:hypothetical protein DPMN_067135 [Dreissena polymorpha]|uniref:Uncharacterized protein n=1 Tax=Dreissena polymorpha TaxID=45954 RepID=A0A9D3YXI0_DREPO|nr:hypothetical protein DPMN_067135 [Dreissena polymorpha]
MFSYRDLQREPRPQTRAFLRPHGGVALRGRLLGGRAGGREALPGGEAHLQHHRARVLLAGQFECWHHIPVTGNQNY